MLNFQALYGEMSEILACARGGRQQPSLQIALERRGYRIAAARLLDANRIRPEDRDSLAERGGFEPPVPRGLLWAGFRPEFGPVFFGPTRSNALERICSSEFDSASALLVRFVRQFE